MPDSSVRWRLEGGYSRLLDRTRVEVTLEKGPAHQQLNLTPLGLFKEPTELILRVTHGFKASGPGNLRWRLQPGARLRAVVLQPRNAYLGNFRVPETHFAIQWDVEGEVTSRLLERFSRMLISAEAGSTLVHSWVTLFSSEVSLVSAIQQSWEAYVDPFDPKEVLRLRERQVIRFRWSGRLGTVIGVEWGLGTGWQVGASKSLLELETALKARALLQAELEISQRGSFVLRLSRRSGQIQVSVAEDRELSLTGQLEVRATLRDTVKLKPGWSATAPLFEPLNDRLAEAVGRRAEIALVLESERWRRRHALLKAIWKKPTEHLFFDDYRKLVSGKLPAPRPGLELSGRIETMRGKRLTVALNILSWIRLGRSSEKRKYYRVDLGPSGELTVEEGNFVEKTRYRWDQLQLVSLLCTQRTTDAETARKFLWTFQKKKKFERIELVRMLKKALHLRSISSFDLPAARRFPLQLDLCWCSEFSEAGIETIQKSPQQNKWEALVTALEVAEPENYKEGRFMRDWIVSSKVRETIDVNPIQSHLESIYPLAGRSSFERRQVVGTYLRVKKFLQLVEVWERGEEKRLIDSLDLGWELPIFFWFHLLCPTGLRKSVVILRGDLERVWGEPAVIDDR